MSYVPKPGSIADRALAYLELQPRGTELTTSKFAEAISADAVTLMQCLAPALNAGRIFRRQKDRQHSRSPWFWSLTKAPATAVRIGVSAPAAPAMNGSGAGAHRRGDGSQTPNGDGVDCHAKAGSNTPQQGANRDASAGQSHVAEGSASPYGRGGNAPTARGAAPVVSPTGLLEGRDSQQVLKAEGASPDATDRDNPAMASPRGGAMGTGQPAAAGPVGGKTPPFVAWASTDGRLVMCGGGLGDEWVSLDKTEADQIRALFTGRPHA